MYKVMIVDDETIILSGIKFLVDWEKNDCVLSATARNGEDALEQIRKMPPDIVLADINMPVMDGITLLSRVNQEFPYIVFIMLTNLEEFELARQALHHRAVDYLVKSRLDGPMLEEALNRAKKERRQRARLTMADSADFFEQKKQQEAVNKALQEIVLLGPGEGRETGIQLLTDRGLLEKYGYFYITFDYSAMPDAEQMTMESRTDLMKWIRELLQKTAENIYRGRYILVDTGQPDVLVMFVYQETGKWTDKAEMFRKKFSSTVKNITQADCRILNTGCYADGKDLKACAAEYQKLAECSYLEIEPWQWPYTEQAEYEPLGLQGIGLSLAEEIRRRNLRGVQLVLDRAESAVRNVFHQKSQAIWLLNELNRWAGEALAEQDPAGGPKEAGEKRISSVYEIDCIQTRSQVLAWLDMLGNILRDVLESQETKENLAARKARKYVLAHIEDHVTLQEAADYVKVSPGYLSTIFKKEYHQSFVDFMNQTKMEYACTLLKNRNMKIMDIAWRMGYENAYYFSKVFRKYMGMSPTDYQKGLEDEKSIKVKKSNSEKE